MADTKPKNVLFITFDLGGYYDCIKEELNDHFDEVNYYNLEDYKNLPYTGFSQRIKSFYYKKFKKLKLKNFLKYQPLIEEISNKKYDTTIIVRPDLFFDSQLEIIRKNSKNLIAYYHDSINNITRKKDVIHFFDKVYSYEKADVKNYHLSFISNFIYLKDYKTTKVSDISFFTVMSKDFRFESLLKLATYLKNNNYNTEFLVHSSKEHPKSEFVNFITDRKNNSQVLEYIQKHKIIVDIHKYGVQDGLTFRVFESLFFEKKLITSNLDIKNYDFYNPNNILIIEDFNAINIPKAFINSPYEKIPDDIYNSYHYSYWLKTVLNKH